MTSLREVIENGEVRGNASSSYTRENITTRMAKLAAMDQTAEVIGETRFLEHVLERWDQEHGVQT